MRVSRGTESVMAQNEWLGARTGRRMKRSRDIRDFIVVHGKVVKPTRPGEHGSQPLASANSAADVPQKKTRQATFPRLHSTPSCGGERRWESELKVPASRFSKGVRKKKALAVLEADSVCSLTNVLETREDVGKRGDVGKENVEARLSQSSTEREVDSMCTRCPLILIRENHNHFPPLQLCRGHQKEPSNTEHESRRLITTTAVEKTPSIIMETTSPTVPLPAGTRTLTVSVDLRSKPKEGRGTPNHQPHVATGSRLDPSEGNKMENRDVQSHSSKLLDIDLSLPFTDTTDSSLEPGSQSMASWNTDDLLAELSSCERL